MHISHILLHAAAWEVTYLLLLQKNKLTSTNLQGTLSLSDTVYGLIL